MSDHTNPPAGEHHRGALGGPQGPYGGPPQNQPQQPYGPPAQPNPYGQPGGSGNYSQSSQGPSYGSGGPQGPQPGGQPSWQQPGAQNQPHSGQPGGGQYGSGQQQGGQYGGGQYGGQQQGGQQYGGQYGGQQPGGQQYGAQQGGQYEGPQGGPPQGPPYGGMQAQQWQPEPPRKRRGRLVPLIAALAVLIVFGAGGAFAYSRLNGGGDQPAAVLPGNAIAYARVDLDPSAGQRVAALRFLMKFPSVKDRVGLTSDNDDVRQKLFELIKKENGEELSDVDYDRDVKPWLGDRFGFAAVPGTDGKQPDAVVAVQVKDQGKAKAGLDKLFADEKKKPGVAFSGDYALIAEDQGKADAAVAAGKDNPLKDNDKFDRDMSDLGEQGVASFWADTKALAEVSGRRLTEQQRGALPEGSAAAALRFDSQYLELKGIVHGDKSLTAGKADAGDLVGKLPNTTAGAIAISDGENLVGKVWEQLQKSSAAGGIELGDLTKGFKDQYGIALPDDLKPLLGKNLAIAVDKGNGSEPKVAARMETDPAKAEAVVDKLTNLMRSRTSQNVPIQKAKDDDTLVLATDQAYAEQVLKDGDLGESENYKQALPDTKGAVMLGYVDFEAISSLNRRTSQNKDVAALRSAGTVVRVTGDGEAEFSLRVVVK